MSQVNQVVTRLMLGKRLSARELWFMKIGDPRTVMCNVKKKFAFESIRVPHPTEKGVTVANWFMNKEQQRAAAKKVQP